LATTLHILHQATRLFLDGTFFVAPLLFEQLVSIHCFWRGRQFPIAFALLSGKDAALYEAMFNLLMELTSLVLGETVPDIRARFYPDFMCDYVSGLLASIRLYFPHSRIRGCYFHFTQCVYHHVKHLGYAWYYLHDDGFRFRVRCIIALGFVPWQLKKRVLYDDSWEFLRQDARIRHFLDSYFIPTWVNGSYELWLWDWFMVEVKTNNLVEGWNHGMKVKFKHSAHPVLWEFLDVMGKECGRVRNNVFGRQVGKPLPAANATYASVNLDIMNLCREFHLRPPLEFLQAVAAQVAAPKAELNYNAVPAPPGAATVQRQIRAPFTRQPKRQRRRAAVPRQHPYAPPSGRRRQTRPTAGP
jgi:hypothetical protein